MNKYILTMRSNNLLLDEFRVEREAVSAEDAITVANLEYENCIPKSVVVGCKIKEMAKSTILQECCEALGWQGGTIHQIKQVLIKAQKARRAYRTMNMPQANDADIEYFKASMAELDYVLSNSF